MSNLLDDVIGVLADGKDRDATEVLAALRNAGIAPKAGDPLGYVQYTLSANKEIFARITNTTAEHQRRRYRLAGTNGATGGMDSDQSPARDGRPTDPHLHPGSPDMVVHVRGPVPATWARELDHLGVDLRMSRPQLVTQGMFLLLRYHNRGQGLPEPPAPAQSGERSR